MAEEMIAGRYRLLEPLGRGAMSAVWLAEDTELGRRVAVKTLSVTADRARFEREARAAGALSHPNICALYDYGESDGKPFMVLEYLPSGSLEDRLADVARLPDFETRRIAAELAAGLAHAHGRGLVHRDLKPANVLFDTEDRAKIADFGIVRMGGERTLTEVGTVLGTAAYISPEQASGKPAGPASDVYSFGVILFRMLTGRLPFVSTNAMELVRMHRDEEPPRIRTLRPDVPADLERVATAALAKNPADRPPDGAALLRALGGGQGERTPVVRRRAQRRRSAVLFAVSAAALALLAGGIALAIVATRGSGRAPTAPAPGSSLSLPAVTTAATPPVTTRPSTTQPAATAQSAVLPTATEPATTAAAPTTSETATTETTTAQPATTVETTTAAAPTTT